MDLKDLSTVSAEELKQFLDSFDNVLCDCDGVLISEVTKAFPGAADSYKVLKQLGKTVRFVSNNCSISLQLWHKKLNHLGYDMVIGDMVNPICAIISYLKSINFDKHIFAIGFSSFQNELKEAGFKVAENVPDRIDESVSAFMKMLEDDKRIGAVICDWDFNMNYISIARSTVFLSNPDVLFITAASDEKLPFSKKNIPGPGLFQNLISNFTSREPINFGKPSSNLNDYIRKNLVIADPSRTLFVGDSLRQDMEFATESGYKKLLVLTGITKMDDLENIKESQKPDFYLHEFAGLHKIIKDKLPFLLTNKL